jgi:tetratricopeptide (TPR) repeat protein
VTPTNVVILSGILRRCPGPAQQTLAKKLALSASEMGEKTATFELVQTAINQSRLHEYQAPLQRLGLLAKKENDVEAMALLGKALFSQQKEKEALEWLQKATRPPTGSLEFDGSGDALVYEGRILSKTGDKERAEGAFKKAALDLDEPSAYFYLSQLQEPGSQTQEVYLLKAASSGILEAWHNLGALELAKIEKQEKKPTSLADYGMAREWFQVAAADGFGLSMLNMALMCKAVGQDEVGLAWLDKAKVVPEVREQAKSLRSQWADSQPSHLD